MLFSTLIAGLKKKKDAKGAEADAEADAEAAIYSRRTEVGE